MTGLEEHDRRQLANLRQRLDVFVEGAITLGVLVGELEFLLSALEEVPPECREELKQKWAVLEEVYSGAVTLNGGVVKPEVEALVSKAVEELRERLRVLMEAEAGRDE